MYKVQQTDLPQRDLPNWKTAADSINQPWTEDSCAASAQYTEVPNLTGSLMDNSTVCNWMGSSDNTQCQPAAAPSDSMWDPIPFAPQEFRTEVLDVFGVTAPVDQEPAQQDVSDTAPGHAEPDSTEDPNSGEQQDASALSRARTHPSTAKQKQANARESQRRFRLRQKVFTAPSCQLYASQNGTEPFAFRAA